MDIMVHPKVSFIRKFHCRILYCSALRFLFYLLDYTSIVLSELCVCAAGQGLAAVPGTVAAAPGPGRNPGTATAPGQTPVPGPGRRRTIVTGAAARADHAVAVSPAAGAAAALKRLWRTMGNMCPWRTNRSSKGQRAPGSHALVVAHTGTSVLLRPGRRRWDLERVLRLGMMWMSEDVPHVANQTGHVYTHTNTQLYIAHVHTDIPRKIYCVSI